MTRLDELRGEHIRAALSDCLSGVDAMPSRRARILRAVHSGARVRRRKLAVVVALALAMTLLAGAAVAAVLLSMRDVVEQEALPMALANDGDSVNDEFTNDELTHIIAIAQDNGFEVPQAIKRALERGEGYWEEETIMALAKAEFGPIPGRWTLEQQYWFEETVVAIGFKDVNYARVPGEGELSYEQALDCAKRHLATEYGASDLEDESLYAITRGYYEYEPDVRTWYFWFEPLDLAQDEYIITMDAHGKALETQVSTNRATAYDEVMDHYTELYGSVYGWPQEAWVAFGRDVQGVTENGVDIATGFKRTNYMDVPEDAMPREEAGQIAVREAGVEGGQVYCAVLYGGQPNPIWKVTVWNGDEADIFASRILEIDAVTGDLISLIERVNDDNWTRHFISEEAASLIPSPSPDGLG